MVDNNVDNNIVKFIKRHHVLTLATSLEDQPYCANAFYAYDSKRNLIVFTSDIKTRHGQEMSANPKVAASIVLETRVVGKIEGLQIMGEIVEADSEAKSTYIKRFPYTALADLSLWAIEPNFMKYTDNKLGFGKKLIWNRE